MKSLITQPHANVQIGTTGTFNHWGQMLTFLTGLTVNNGQAWPVANTALTIPFNVFAPMTLKAIGWLNGGAVSGNMDVGVYDTAWKLVASTGSFAQANTDTWKSANVTETLLMPGLYHMAVALDNTSGRLAVHAVTPGVQMTNAMGAKAMQSAFPLPATFVPVSSVISVHWIPTMSVLGKGVPALS